MRLDFNVLWVEDRPDSVAAEIVALRRRMAEEGFELKHTLCTNVEEVNNRLSDDVFKDEIDLIMVDYDLGAGVEGQTVITRIREEIFYKEIVFYSANTDLNALKKASFDEGHGGIYFVHREYLVTEVYDLFLSLIKKVLDLDHMRGIVMGATSDIDQMARECLQIAHDMLDDAGRKGVLQEMVQRLDQRLQDLEKQIKKLKNDLNVQGIIGAHHAFTANDGLRILLRLLRSDAIGNHSAYAGDVQVYIEKVVPQRNRLGHQVLSPAGRPEGVPNAGGMPISLEELRILRVALLDARQKFRALHEALSASV